MINKHLVEERSRDIGDFLVGRLLPFRKKRQVGPFTFIDHMGPTELGNGRYLDVDQHPHTGLCTLTWLIEGEIEHRDSMGTVQRIGPGDVGFMCSGKGVTHTERTPLDLRDGRPSKVHGYQVWVALPKEQEEADPSFQFLNQHDLPQWEHEELAMILVAGQGFGKRSPLVVPGEAFMLDVRSNSSEVQKLKLDGELKGEIALVVVEGGVMSGEDQIQSGQMLISKTEDHCQLDLNPDTHLLIFGGEAYPEERFMMWNFVSTDKELLRHAALRWTSKEFPQVPGDNTYVPLPEPLKKKVNRSK